MAVRKRSVSSGTPGVIHRDELYTMAEVEDRLRVKGYTLREASRAGLKSKRLSRVKLILGEDLIEFIRELPDDTPATATSDSDE